MSMLSRIDDWLIEGPYQSVVDLSQRKPEWWARQSLIANLMMAFIRVAVFSVELAWRDYLILTICAACSAGIWITTLSPAWFAGMGQARFFRLFLVGMAVTRLVALIGGDPVRSMAGLLNDLALMSVYYFAACKPPRPRAPRFKLAPGGAA